MSHEIPYYIPNMVYFIGYYGIIEVLCVYVYIYISIIGTSIRDMME